MSNNSNTNCNTNIRLDKLLHEVSTEDLAEIIEILKERYSIK
jgi:hypothetical protein